jgi:hypothetical protein
VKGPKSYRDFVIEWDEDEPLPPGAVYTLALPYADFAQLIAVRVASNQRTIDGRFTIRARIAKDAISVTYMDNKQLKESLAGLGLSKQEVEIILGAIEGVKIAPLAYSQLNDMTAEVVELKAFKEKVQAFTGELVGIKDNAAKAPRKPRADKGKTRAAAAFESKEPVVIPDEPTLKPEAPGKPAKADKPKKAPTPRKTETEEEIKANVASLGDQAPPPGVDL